MSADDDYGEYDVSPSSETGPVDEAISSTGTAGEYPVPETGVPAGEGDKMRIVEALVFASPGPVSVGSISEITGIEPGAVREILNSLVDFYSERDGGIVIREVAGGFGFYAKPDAAPYVSRMIKSQVNPRLTRAALECMAIVAYLQPVSRGVVAEIRGVQSDGVIRTLDERGLIRPAGKGGPPGYPLLYETTERFLERFGLMSLDDLPPLEQFAPDSEIIEKIRTSLSWELVEGDVSPGAETGTDSEDTVRGGNSVTPGIGGTDTVGEGDQEREEGAAR